MCREHPGFVRRAISRPFSRYGSMLLLYYVKVNGFLSLALAVRSFLYGTAYRTNLSFMHYRFFLNWKWLRIGKNLQNSTNVLAPLYSADRQLFSYMPKRPENAAFSAKKISAKLQLFSYTH